MTVVDKIEVENVNVPGHVSRVDAEKYLAMRKVLLKILPGKPPGLTQAEMGQAALPHLPQHLWPNGDKAMWWIKTVQLDLEAKGIIERDAKCKPLRWNKARQIKK